MTVGLLGDFIYEDYLKGHTIATDQLKAEQLPAVVDCIGRRSLNKQVPHLALQAARRARAAAASKEAAETSPEFKAAMKGLAEALVRSAPFTCCSLVACAIAGF